MKTIQVKNNVELNSNIKKYKKIKAKIQKLKTEMDLLQNEICNQVELPNDLNESICFECSNNNSVVGNVKFTCFHEKIVINEKEIFTNEKNSYILKLIKDNNLTKVKKGYFAKSIN